jgi:hypothetical protein
MESPFIVESGAGSMGIHTGRSSGSLKPRHARGRFSGVTCGNFGRMARIESSDRSVESRTESSTRRIVDVGARDSRDGEVRGGDAARGPLSPPARLSDCDSSARALSPAALSATVSSRARHAANTASTIAARTRRAMAVRIRILDSVALFLPAIITVVQSAPAKRRGGLLERACRRRKS